MTGKTEFNSALMATGNLLYEDDGDDGSRELLVNDYDNGSFGDKTSMTTRGFSGRNSLGNVHQQNALNRHLEWRNRSRFGTDGTGGGASRAADFVRTRFFSPVKVDVNSSDAVTKALGEGFAGKSVTCLRNFLLNLRHNIGQAILAGDKFTTNYVPFTAIAQATTNGLDRLTGGEWSNMGPGKVVDIAGATVQMVARAVICIACALCVFVPWVAEAAIGLVLGIGAAVLAGLGFCIFKVSEGLVWAVMNPTKILSAIGNGLYKIADYTAWVLCGLVGLLFSALREGGIRAYTFLTDGFLHMHLQTQSARLDVAENDELSKPDKFVLKMKHFDTIGEQYPVTARRYRDDFHIEPAGFEISDDERHALIASLGTNLSPEAYNKEKQAFAAAVRFGQRQGLPLEDARALALEILRGGAPTSMTSSNDAVVTSPLMSSAGDHDVAMSLTRRPQLLSEMMADERAADKSGSIFRYATPERFRGKPVNALEQEVYTRTAGLRQPPKFKRSASMVSGMDDSSPVKQIADKASRPWYSYLNPFNWGGSRVAVSKMGLNGTSDERHLVDEENMGGV